MSELPYVTSIKIKSDGLYFITSQGEIPYSAEDGYHILPYLDKVVDIESGVTVKQFFNSIAPESEVLDVVFACYADRFDAISTIVDYVNREVEEEYDSLEEIEYVEVYLEPLMEGAFSHHIGFCGIGGDIFYSLSYQPISTIADAELRINEEFIVYTACLGEEDPNDFQKILDSGVTTPAYLTLHDVIRGIVYDMTFAGLVEPGHKSEFLEGLKETIRQIEEGEVEENEIVEIDDLRDLI